MISGRSARGNMQPRSTMREVGAGEPAYPRHDFQVDIGSHRLHSRASQIMKRPLSSGASTEIGVERPTQQRGRRRRTVGSAIKIRRRVVEAVHLASSGEGLLALVVAAAHTAPRCDTARSRQ